jgi:DNA gyrase/topoisomerase IV subunit B
MIWKNEDTIILLIATDADVDGMHIRLLLITFLAVFPQLIKEDICIFCKHI